MIHNPADSCTEEGPGKAHSKINDHAHCRINRMIMHIVRSKIVRIMLSSTHHHVYQPKVEKPHQLNVPIHARGRSGIRGTSHRLEEAHAWHTRLKPVHKAQQQTCAVSSACVVFSCTGPCIKRGRDKQSSLSALGLRCRMHSCCMRMNGCSSCSRHDAQAHLRAHVDHLHGHQHMRHLTASRLASAQPSSLSDGAAWSGTPHCSCWDLGMLEQQAQAVRAV